MGGVEVASLDREPERSRTDPEDASGFAEIHPSFRGPSILIVARDLVVGAERDHSFAHAVRVHLHLAGWYRTCGYELHEVPRLPACERARHVLGVLERGA